MTTAQNAAEAFARFKTAYDTNCLVQSVWHKKIDGRELACALGVLGPDVRDPEDCPAAIMPRWLANMVPWFFDGQKPDAAKNWGLKFYAELKRLNGVIPFSVVHDWHARVVGPLAIEIAQKQGRQLATHEALMQMHAKAATGQKFTEEEWRSIINAAYVDVYNYATDANTDTYAYASAHVNAHAYANAYAHAAYVADADATNAAYAHAAYVADAHAAYVADADATNADAATMKIGEARSKIISRFADGMVDCLAGVNP